MVKNSHIPGHQPFEYSPCDNRRIHPGNQKDGTHPLVSREPFIKKQCKDKACRKLENQAEQHKNPGIIQGIPEIFVSENMSVIGKSCKALPGSVQKIFQGNVLKAHLYGIPDRIHHKQDDENYSRRHKGIICQDLFPFQSLYSLFPHESALLP